MVSHRKKNSVIAKGRLFPFQVAAACWVDLLGYGGMVAESGFNPLHPAAKTALNRLHEFHSDIAKASSRHFPTLILNEGAVAYRDLSMRGRSVTHDFLLRSWALFQRIRDSEKARNFPGARMVLTTGFRIRNYKRPIQPSPHVESILKRFRENLITPEQAIQEAGRSRAPVDIIPELQANFAFTRAYVADSDGSRKGLGGPNFFVDLSLFEVESPPLATVRRAC